MRAAMLIDIHGLRKAERKSNVTPGCYTHSVSNVRVHGAGVTAINPVRLCTLG